MPKAYSQLETYKRNQFYTADRGTILLMLYQGAVDFLNRASGHLEQGEIAEKGVCLSKAHAIIAELRTSLNFEVGGDLSRNLEDLYLYMLEQIATANMNNDPKLLEVVISLMVRLKEAWGTAIVTERKRVAQEPPA